MIFSSAQLQLPAAEVRASGGSRSSAAGAWSTATPDYEGVAKQVMRTDIYEEAMKEIGVHARRPRTTTPETLFDGVAFDPEGAGGVRDGLSPCTA